MSGNLRIGLAGVLAAFVISAAGFGVDSMLAVSPAKQPSGYQPRAVAQPATPVRVILPASAEPARPPEPSSVVVSAAGPQPQAEPPRAVPPAGDWKVESVDSRAAAAEESRRRYLERKSRRMAARARQEMQALRQRPEAGILAFGGDEPGRGGSFGN